MCPVSDWTWTQTILLKCISPSGPARPGLLQAPGRSQCALHWGRGMTSTSALVLNPWLWNEKIIGQITLVTNSKGFPATPTSPPSHPLPSFHFPKWQCPLPGGGLSFLSHREQNRTNKFSDYSRQSNAGTIGISDLKETIQFIAAHVKAIRRIMKRFSIWCPKASKNYMRKGLGRNPFLFRNKEGRSQASAATWKRHSSPTVSPGLAWRVCLWSGPGSRGRRPWLVRLFH